MWRIPDESRTAILSRFWIEVTLMPSSLMKRTVRPVARELVPIDYCIQNEPKEMASSLFSGDR